MSKQPGLWIGGDHINNSDAVFMDVVRFVVVAPDKQDNPVFQSGSRVEIEALADPMSLEIVEAMQADTAPQHWDEIKELQDNIRFRKNVIAMMRSMTTGEWDADYFEAAQNIPPTLGKCQNLRFMIDGLTKPSANPGYVADVMDEMNQHWNHLDVHNTPWAGWVFKRSKNSPSAATSLKNTRPFRGECAGAVLLSLLEGCRLTYGDESVNALEPYFGPVYIGRWYGKSLSQPSCGRALYYNDKAFSQEYARGSVIAVPGDYVYFQNAHDYYDKSHHGAWQGENCIYMGKDWLGHPHYSGLGLGWKTEATLRMFLHNAYTHDCHAALIKKVDKKTREVSGKMNVLQDPEKQLRFQMRGILRYPDLSKISPNAEEPAKPRDVPPPDDMEAMLSKLGIGRMGDNLWGADAIPLVSLMKALGFVHDDLNQMPKTPANRPRYGLRMGEWELVLRDASDTPEAYAPPRQVEVRVRRIV